MTLDRRLNRLEEQMRTRSSRDRTHAERVETLCRRLMRRAEHPDSSVAGRVAWALADGQPERATALLNNHMNEKQNP
jgi:hypothetical protein